MPDNKYNIIFMRDDTAVKRYRMSPFMLKATILLAVFLVIFSVTMGVTSLYYGIHTRSLRKVNKHLTSKLQQAEMDVKRLENVEKILESYDYEELDMLTTSLEEKKELKLRTPVDLKDIFSIVDLHQIGIDNIQAKYIGDKIWITFEINNLQTMGVVAGDISFDIITREGSVVELPSGRQELSFEINRFKRIRTMVKVPDPLSPEQIFALRLSVNDPTGKMIFSETYPLSHILT